MSLLISTNSVLRSWATVPRRLHEMKGYHSVRVARAPGAAFAISSVRLRKHVSLATNKLSEVVQLRAFLPCCFAAYVVVRLLVIVALPIVPSSDSAWYVAMAKQLAAGNGYWQDGHPTAYWPVGYPAFLAIIFSATGPNLWVARLMNLALSCGIFVLTYCTAMLVLKNAVAARLAVLLLTIYPNQIGHTGVLGAEMLGTLLLLLGTVAAIGPMTPLRSTLSGAVFGLGTLVRAQFLLIPAIILWVSWRASGGSKAALLRTIAAGALMGATLLCVVLPWSARNYLVFHHVVLISTNGGMTFLTGNNPQARGDYTPDSPLVTSVRAQGGGEVAIDQRAYGAGMDWIREHPLRFAILVPMKIWRLWAPDGESEWGFQAGFASYDDHVLAFRMIRVANQAYYFLMLVAAAVGMWRLLRADNAPSVWAQIGTLLILYTTMISVVFSGQSRFHFPVMPWVFICAAWFLTGLFQRESQRPERAQLVQPA